MPQQDEIRAVEEIVERLFALVDRLRGGFEVAVSQFDLSPPQAKALRYLAQAGPVPMRDLAFCLRCDASNVTGIVDRLEERGLVERRPARTDRRVKTLVVTEAGAVLAGQVWSFVLQEAVSMVELNEEEHVTMLMLLRRFDAGPSHGCWISQS